MRFLSDPNSLTLSDLVTARASSTGFGGSGRGLRRILGTSTSQIWGLNTTTQIILRDGALLLTEAFIKSNRLG